MSETLTFSPPNAARVRRLRGTRLCTLAVLLAMHVACEIGSEPSEVSGHANDSNLAEPTHRIVSLTPVATRFVVELGVGERLVGIDSESARIPGLSGLPIVDLETARTLAPDFVLHPTLTDAAGRAVIRMESEAISLVEFSPHDLEDVAGLCRGLGSRFVGVANAALFERRFSRPLAMVGGISPPLDRLRVVAVVDFDPLTLAGGHSFETDLIEIGGGTSVTHGKDDSRIVMTQEKWDEFAPDLVIVTTRSVASEADRRAARAALPDHVRVEFFDFDREMFWLDRPEEDAERMRLLIAAVDAEIRSLAR